MCKHIPMEMSTRVNFIREHVVAVGYITTT